MSTKDSAAAATEYVDTEAWAAIEATKPQVNTTVITDERTNSLIYIELYDSGVMRHMSPYKEKFINYHTIDP